VVAALLGLLGLLVPGVAHAAPPPNDDFDQAVAIATLPFTTTQATDEATQAADDPTACYGTQRSVWFTYTATTSGTITATTAGSGYDTALSAYTGSRGSLTQLGCNDDADGGYHSRLDLAVVAGTRYHFMVAAFGSGSAGPASFSVTAFAQAENDAFADATPVTVLPHAATPDLATATVEPGEPNSSCGTSTRSLWYAVTLPETTPVTLTSSTYSAGFGVYTGSTLANLTEVRCTWSETMTFRATAGTTYYVRLANTYNSAPTLHLTIGVAQPIEADFSYYPYNASVFDTISFYDQSTVPGGSTSVTRSWDFGDGTTAEGDYPQHRYAADGDYPVTLTVATSDGRTGSVTNVVGIRTHDVAITRFTTPGTAVVGATKTLTARIGNTRYAEDVTVRLYRSTPSGWQEIAHSTQYVPASATGAVNFPFNYTFRPEDAALGKINFKAVATLSGTPDALPLDNEVISVTTAVQSAATGRDAA
jgi:hypothetical protein